jgi:hypothetical protein
MNLIKFRRLSPDDMTFALDIVEKNRLFMSRPSGLNDPFDCAMPNVASPQDLQTAALYSMERHRETLKLLADACGEKFDEDALLKGAPAEMLEDFISGEAQREIEERLDKGFRVLSLSDATEAKNILMWSHYADSHQGICLEFDNSKFIDPPTGYEAKYENTAAPIAFFSENQEERIRMLRTKSKVWEYEHEFRYIYPNFNMSSEKIYLRFEPSSLKIVRFGVKCDAGARKTFMGACRRDRPTPVFIQMVKSVDGLKLEENILEQ